jgi:hypothetical protein
MDTSCVMCDTVIIKQYAQVPELAPMESVRGFPTPTELLIASPSDK